uniref:Uncharacterized protein MANES_10G129700 n=1 Tax=Rhizophora mucronata TaxID=61149 RepID=A0A2P2J6G1_RHIMU
MGLSRISREFSWKCVFVFFLSLSLLLSALFWVIPVRTVKLDGFDAKDSIKLSATVQASFRLQKPVSHLIPHIESLEYDIYGEIGVPDSKVLLLPLQFPLCVCVCVRSGGMKFGYLSFCQVQHL